MPYAIHVGAWLVLVGSGRGHRPVGRSPDLECHGDPGDGDVVRGDWTDGAGPDRLVAESSGGPEPIRSQLVLLAQQRAGHQVLAIGPMSFGASDDLAGIMRIRPGEPAPAGAAVWGCGARRARRYLRTSHRHGAAAAG